MQPKKFRILSAITAGSLGLAAVAAITVSSGTGPTATHAALACTSKDSSSWLWFDGSSRW